MPTDRNDVNDLKNQVRQGATRIIAPKLNLVENDAIPMTKKFAQQQ